MGVLTGIGLLGLAPDRSEAPRVSIAVEAPTYQKPVVAGAALTPANVARGQTLTFVVKAKTAPSWHINAADLAAGGAIATSLKLKLPKGVVTDGEWNYPDPIPNPQGEGFIYEGALTFYRTLKVTSEAPPGLFEVTCDFGYQACDPSTCRPPAKLSLKAKASVVAAR